MNMYDVKIKGGEHENDTNHRDQLIRDMIYVCCLPNLSEKSRREFLDKAVIWPLSDKGEENIAKSAKYKGCKYWSTKAYEKHIGQLLNGTEKDKELKGFSKSGLTHEHVIPKCIFIKTMEKYFEKLRNEITSDNAEKRMNEAFNELKEIISKNLYACVITDEEDDELSKSFKDKMPDNEEDFFKIKHPWDRYIKTDHTELYEVQWESKKNIRGEDALGWNYIDAKKVKIDDIVKTTFD